MKAKYGPFFYISILLSIVMGALFLFSGYSKLYPVEPFEYTFIDLGVANWMTAPFMARAMVGLEFYCGLLLILHFQMRRFTLPMVVALLLFFCVYLSMVIAVKGNKGNCGCFGELLSMTPLQAIIKNIGLLLICMLIYMMTDTFKFPFAKWIGAVILVISMAMPFILNTVDLENSKNLQPESANYRLPLELLYESKKAVNVPPKIDLKQGKFIIVYLSLTCPHCRIAAQKIHVLHKKNPAIPFYLVLNGKMEAYQPYVETYGLGDIPHQIFFGPEEYVKMSGPELPQILWVHNSMVEKKSSYQNLSQSAIEKWLADTTAAKPAAEPR